MGNLCYSSVRVSLLIGVVYLLQRNAKCGGKGMAKVNVSTDAAPKSAAYSQAVKAGGLVFVSGQGPFDAKTGVVVGKTIQEQTAQCLRNIEAILRAANSSLDKVVSATFILAEESDFAGMNE